jgi:hypothetical protein
MTLQDIWIDFKIISMLEPARKLYINDGMLALEPISVLSPIKRWLTNSNRRGVITRIKQRVEELEGFCKNDPVALGDNMWIKDDLIKLIDKVKLGLNNLRETYNDDSQMSANIELIVARLEYIRYFTNESI